MRVLTSAIMFLLTFSAIPSMAMNVLDKDDVPEAFDCIRDGNTLTCKDGDIKKWALNKDGDLLNKDYHLSKEGEPTPGSTPGQVYNDSVHTYHKKYLGGR